jgi:hypothetical protein
MTLTEVERSRLQRQLRRGFAPGPHEGLQPSIRLMIKSRGHGVRHCRRTP